MSTLSSRLKLELPNSLTDSMSLGDDILSSNYDIIDLNAHCRIVDELVDIINPYEGQHVHVNSDSTNYIRRDNEWTTFTTPPSTGGTGLIDRSSFTAKVTINNTVETRISQITFTPVAGIRYLIKASLSIGRSLSNSLNGLIRLRSATGTNVTTSGTLLIGRNFNIFSDLSVDVDTGTSGDISLSVFTEIFPNNTTELSVGLFIANTSGSDPLISNPISMNSGTVTYSSFSVTNWGSS